MQCISSRARLTYHARIKIKHVAQKFVLIVKVQMDHLRIRLTFVVVEPLYVNAALAMEIASK